MARSISKTEEEVLKPSEPVVPLIEDYWPFVGSVTGTALLSLGSQLAVSLALALQWNIPIEIRRWAGIFPHLVFRANRPEFEAIVYWSMVLSVVFLAVFSLSGFLWRRRLQIQAGRLFAWVDIFLIGLTVLLRFYLTGFDVGATNIAWGFVVIGLTGLAVGSWIVYKNLDRTRRVHNSYPSRLDQSFV